jgi:hypothetical protein
MVVPSVEEATERGSGKGHVISTVPISGIQYKRTVRVRLLNSSHLLHAPLQLETNGQRAALRPINQFSLHWTTDSLLHLYQAYLKLDDISIYLNNGVAIQMVLSTGLP